ncbi:MAG: GGDEF domain-containing protein [Pseudomonadota bacterium]
MNWTNTESQQSAVEITPRHTENILPFDRHDQGAGRTVSDAVLLRIANILQTSLHLKDVVKGFSQEVAKIIPTVSLRYRHRAQRCDIQCGAAHLHKYSYDINIVGRYIGEVTFSAAQPMSVAEQEVLETLLCSLVYPLRNALQYERALRIALKDPLTGISNRASFDAHLKHHLSLSERMDAPLSLIIFDLDHFKRINDEFGHVVGDLVLTEVAQKIASCVRDSDSVFRYGGEEFVIVLPNTTAAGAELLAERIRGETETLSFDNVPGHLQVTVSGGVAHYRFDESRDDLVARADQALYDAKEHGRNRIEVA